MKHFLLLLLLSSPLFSNHSGDASFHVGKAKYSKGYSDVRHQGGNINFSLSKKWKGHIDETYVEREEKAGFVSGGTSYIFNKHVTSKIMVGSSTKNRSILPLFLLHLAADLQTHPKHGWRVVPNYFRRKYRNGAKTDSVDFQIIRYFKRSKKTDNYFVSHTIIGVSRSKPGNRLSHNIGMGLTYVKPLKSSYGIMFEGGLMAYDSVLDFTSVRNRFFSVKPSASFYLTNKLEFFIRAEYVRTAYYNIGGGHTGLKIMF